VPATGAAAKGWLTISGQKYYFWAKGQGTYATGLRKIGSDTYYFTSKGVMKKGWQNVKEARRYFVPATGAAAKGWLTISGQKYYFPTKGVGTYATGLRKIGTQEYFFNSNGVLQISKTITKNGWRYVTDPNGVVLSKEKTGAVLRGIDVSYAQGNNIDWAAVKASGVKFAIIRAGYTGWSGTGFNIDSTYVRNVREAKKQGLMVGTYLYVYSRDTAELTRALDDFNKQTKANGLTFDLPVYLDIEDSQYFLPSTNALGGYSYRTNMIRSGLNQLKKQGYKTGFYANLHWANYYFDAQQLSKEGHAFWLAHWYGNNAELNPNTAAWNGTYPAVWQYRSTGRVPGISGNVDMNYLYP